MKKLVLFVILSFLTQAEFAYSCPTKVGDGSAFGSENPRRVFHATFTKLIEQSSLSNASVANEISVDEHLLAVSNSANNVFEGQALRLFEAAIKYAQALASNRQAFEFSNASVSANTETNSGEFLTREGCLDASVSPTQTPLKHYIEADEAAWRAMNPKQKATVLFRAFFQPI